MDRTKFPCRWSEGYLSLLFLLLPLSLRHGYFDITETKTGVFWLLTGVYLLGLLPAMGQRRSLTAAAWSFVLFAGVGVLSSLLYRPGTSLLAADNRYQGVLTLLLSAGAVCGVSLYGEFTPSLRRCALFSFAAVSLLALLNARGIDPLGVYEGIRASDRSRYLSTVGNVNFLGAYIALLLPLSAGLFCRSRTVRELCLRGAAVFLGAGALLTGSDAGVLGAVPALLLLPCLLRRDAPALRRTAWLLLLLAAAFPLWGLWLRGGIGLSGPGRLLASLPAAGALAAAGLLLLLLQRKRDDNALSAMAGNSIVLPASLFLGGALFLLLANTLLRGRLPASVAAYAQFSPSWGTDRGAVWLHCAELYRSFPPVKKLIGGGAGCLAAWDRTHRLFPDAVLDSAHNEYLHYLLTAGLVGLAAYLASLTAALRQGLQKDGDAPALLAGLIAGALQAAVNIAQCTTVPLLLCLLALCGAEKPTKS